MICKYCKKEVPNSQVHAWEHHRDRFINDVISDLEEHILRQSSLFVKKYGLKEDISDVTQYVKTKMFLLLRDKFDPNIGIAKVFCRTSIHNFLLQVLQSYYRKDNVVLHNNPANIKLNSKFNVSNELRNSDVVSVVMDGETHHEPDGIEVVSGSSTMPDLIADRTFLVNSIESVLSANEYKVFMFLEQEGQAITQQEIADELGISQPAVNRYIKSIRRKVSEVLEDTL